MNSDFEILMNILDIIPHYILFYSIRKNWTKLSYSKAP